ncbi:MAG: hypothetical protein IKA48_02605 [Fibrobacter sp.]|nr:hypothetical protein [Fibrobacter sp.]
MAEIFTRTYDDGTVVESMRNPDRLDALYEKIRDIHKKEFPDWTIPQLFRTLANWDTDFRREYRTDEQFIAKLLDYANELNKKFRIYAEPAEPLKPIMTQEQPCTENP